MHTPGAAWRGSDSGNEPHVDTFAQRRRLAQRRANAPGPWNGTTALRRALEEGTLLGIVRERVAQRLGGWLGEPIAELPELIIDAATATVIRVGQTERDRTPEALGPEDIDAGLRRFLAAAIGSHLRRMVQADVRSRAARAAARNRKRREEIRRRIGREIHAAVLAEEAIGGEAWP